MGEAGMNTRDEITGFKPTKKFFVGIDSDGTVFDSMTIKHIKSFLPAALETWDFGEGAKAFEEIWIGLNLYSESRGINRFAGILLALERMGEKGFFATDLAPLREFVEKSASLSNASLDYWMRKHPSPLLDKVIHWSLKSDVLFEEHTKGILPFGNVDETLRVMAEKADIMVVSSASGTGLDKDWAFSGLTRYTALVAGQEAGSKETQLRMGVAGKYPPQNMLVIGDAPGDLDAARSVGALFFPILPGKEEDSWLRLKEEGLARFFGGTWQEEYEDGLIDEFTGALSRR